MLRNDNISHLKTPLRRTTACCIALRLHLMHPNFAHAIDFAAECMALQA
jgi:hypothetical protein